MKVNNALQDNTFLYISQRAAFEILLTMIHWTRTFWDSSEKFFRKPPNMCTFLFENKKRNF